MFISREEVQSRSGIPVTQDILILAQTMIEAYIGREESEVTEASDQSTLAKATMFQALYIRENTDIVLEQAAVKSLSQNESVIEFNAELFAPFMSPWAVAACKRLSWMGTRTVHTGPIFDGPRWNLSWVND